MRSLTFPAVALLALAGCLGAPAADDALAPANATPAVEIREDLPQTTFKEVATGPSAAADTEATLERAPRWRVGEWWRIAFESPLDGSTAEFVRVVAAVDGDFYVVGMPHEGWYKEAVVYHAPSFGDVNVADLSYWTHDVLFQPLQFPLEDGKTWKTRFSGSQELTAAVKVQDAHTATVTFTGKGGGVLGQLGLGSGGPLLEMVYDATIHEVREFRHPTAVYRVVDHGYDFEGWVTIPRAEDLVFLHGRVAGVLNTTLKPSAPIETVHVEGGFNRMSFIQATVGVGGAPGVYRTYAKGPDGTEYVTESVADGKFNVKFYEATNPDGAWELQHVAAGPGVAFIEGIAYHQYDIHLPSGARRADHSHAVIR